MSSAARGAQHGVARAVHVPHRGDATVASSISRDGSLSEPNLQVREVATARLDTWSPPPACPA